MRKIDHIGVAVRSIDAALRLYEGCLGLKKTIVEEVASQKARVAVLPIGDCRLELLEGMGEDSPVARSIARRGEGLHHICFEVEDIHAELNRLRAAGVPLIDEEPRPGADGRLVVFLHPSGTGGVLIELSQQSNVNPVSR